MGVSERRQRDRERRRAAILDAAAEVFAERGVEGASMDAIAARAELGKATLYYYVRTKEELHAAVLAEGTERFFAELAPVAAGDGDLADLVEALLAGFVRFVREEPTLLRVLVPYLAVMTFGGGEPAHPAPAADAGLPLDPGLLPGHRAFVDALRRRLADSPWADRPDAFLSFVTDVFVALGQRVIARGAAGIERRVTFYVDLVRGHRGRDDEGSATP